VFYNEVNNEGGYAFIASTTRAIDVENDFFFAI
jgi:hypothetical protein